MEISNRNRNENIESKIKDDQKLKDAVVSNNAKVLNVLLNQRAQQRIMQ